MTTQQQKQREPLTHHQWVGILTLACILLACVMVGVSALLPVADVANNISNAMQSTQDDSLLCRPGVPPTKILTTGILVCEVN